MKGFIPVDCLHTQPMWQWVWLMQFSRPTVSVSIESGVCGELVILAGIKFVRLFLTLSGQVISVDLTFQNPNLVGLT